jgi:pyruvate dehydrogenase E2 component (dihydrolipoyllysine-residue acetyltransferase)
MISKVVLAKLSPTMEEGTIVKWTKNEGDAVKVGDVLAEIETDKANMEMEALAAGVLRKILVPAGGKAPVGALIGVIADPNEDIAAVVAQASAPAPAPAAAPAAPAAAPPAPAPAPATARPAAPPAPAPAPQPAAPAADPAPAPRPAPAPAAAAPRAAPRPAVAPSPSAGAPAPVTAVSPPVAAAPAEGRPKASPLARAMAARENVPLGEVSGSGPGGRIVKRDIETYVASPRPAPAAAAAASVVPFPSVAAGAEVPLSNMRKTIAKRLSESAFTAPHFYVTVEIDMGAAVALREQLIKGENLKISYNDLVVKACARALTRFPMVNASWGGDKIATHGEVHVGVAVAIPDGLITPVVRNADQKSVLAISTEIKDLAGRARDKKLRPEEYMGSTFTISNLGMFDVEEFTAIINPPDSAILAVGSVRKVPVVTGDAVGIGHRMKVTMSSDHRVVDGALAAQFLAEVRRLLENPVSLLV